MYIKQNPEQIQQKLTECKEITYSTVMSGDLNIPFSVIDKGTNVKAHKDTWGLGKL